MSIYAIGDVQGCYEPLMALLDKINFKAGPDQLWFTGDIINRGPESLKVMRFIKNLGQNAVTVLGNHEFHYLAVEAGVRQLQSSDTFQDILQALDRKVLSDWIRYRPIVHHDIEKKYLMVHAGFAPSWDLATIMALKKKVEKKLRGIFYKTFLENIFGDTPIYWSKSLSEQDQLRLAINYFTRVRRVDEKGGFKAVDSSQGQDVQPWFIMLSKKLAPLRILFGHWAALEGKTGKSNIFALDTGCCWGNCLTALRLSDLKYFRVNCQ